MTSATQTHYCGKCGGTGDLPHHRNVMGGVCFACKGSGRAPKPPAKPSALWACIYDGKTFFNKRARSEKEALRKAIAHWRDHPDAPAFKDITDVSQIAVKLAEHQPQAYRNYLAAKQKAAA